MFLFLNMTVSLGMAVMPSGVLGHVVYDNTSEMENYKYKFE